MFAAALHKSSPLYLLDEVDAALDEGNQRTVGGVISRIFEGSQVSQLEKGKGLVGSMAVFNFLSEE